MYLVATASPAFEAHARSVPDVTESWLAVRDFPALMETLRHLQPSIVLIDLDLPRLPRRAQLSVFRRYSRSSRLIGIYNHVDEALEIDCLLHGGFKGCCWAGLPSVELARVIAAVEGGEVWIKRAVMAQLLEIIPSALTSEVAAPQAVPSLNPPQLTHRERQIAMLVCTGQANKEIGRELGISERTVKAHLTEIFRKLGIGDRLKLAIQLNTPAHSVPSLSMSN